MLNFTASYVDRPPGVTVRAPGRMAEHPDTGREGEQLACRFLEELGLRCFTATGGMPVTRWT